MPTGRQQQSKADSRLEEKRKSGFFRLIKPSSMRPSHKNTFFGADLQSLRCSEDGVPLLIADCLDFLEKNCETEGLFRLSASQKDLEMACENIERGLPICFSDAQGTGQEHIASAIVKSFLRELPKPLISYPIESAILSKDIDAIRTHIESLPSVNHKLLKRLFQVLVKIDRTHEKNRMDASNLAVIIGPNLTWTENSGEKCTSPLATKIAFILIQNYDYIFGDSMVKPGGSDDQAHDHSICGGTSKVSDENSEESIKNAKNAYDAVQEPSEHILDEMDDDDEQNIIISAVYNLQREMHQIKERLEEERSRRIEFEAIIQHQLADIVKTKSDTIYSAGALSKVETFDELETSRFDQ